MSVPNHPPGPTPTPTGDEMPATLDPSPPAPAAPAVGAPEGPEPTGVRLAAVLSMLLGALAALLLIGAPLAVLSPSSVLFALPGVAAVVLGIVAWRWSRRAQRRTSPMAIAGLWMGAVSVVLGSIPFLLISLLAEPLGEAEPAPESSEQRMSAIAAEEEELDRAVYLAADRLILLRADDAATDDAAGPNRTAGRFPAELAVTTDGDRLLTVDGDELVELPEGTQVRYESWGDGMHFALGLTGTLGASARIDDTTAATPPAE
ncbi:DUF4190 domain-containing protein [Agromyces arachidis]|uniref:DUF4190 domain-containing protein n=1 Tax=Agromyces arachidis TaxID=766966 RepID=UPI0040562317